MPTAVLTACKIHYWAPISRVPPSDVDLLDEKPHVVGSG